MGPTRRPGPYGMARAGLPSPADARSIQQVHRRGRASQVRMIWLQVLLVFVAVAVSDVCWTKYIHHTAEGHRHIAARWSALIYLIGSISIMEYVNNRWLILPAAAGAYVGALVGIKAKE